MDSEAFETFEDSEFSGFQGDYTPLERPSNLKTAPIVPIIPDDTESEGEIRSTDESDSDKEVKKPTIIPPKVIAAPKHPTKKKYDVWCSLAQEDVLLQSIDKCDVSNIDRSRSVETYAIRRNSKRKYSNKDDKSSKSHKRNKFETNGKPNNIVPRFIADLQCTINDSVEDIAKDIANKLYEEKEDLIRTIIEVAGKEKVLELFKEIQTIEKEGGLLILNCSRRRTPGGVFFYLVKNDDELAEQREEIFSQDRANFKQELLAKKKLKHEITKRRIKAEGAKLNAERDAEYEVKNPPPSPVTGVLENGIADDIKTINNSDSAANDIDDELDMGVNFEFL